MKSWCIPKPSARYVAKMEDGLDVYQRPYDPKRPMVGLDEKSKELHTGPNGRLPMAPGQVAKEDYHYERQGTGNLFLVVEPLRGWRHVWVTERKTAVDFAEVVRVLVEEVYPEAEKIVLVTDNLNRHGVAALYERFAPSQAKALADRIEWHYTPEHGSWLNVAECELSALERQCLSRRIGSLEELEQEVAAWVVERNEKQIKVDWQFTTAEARIKLRHLYPQIQKA